MGHFNSLDLEGLRTGERAKLSSGCPWVSSIRGGTSPGSLHHPGSVASYHLRKMEAIDEVCSQLGKRR